MINKLSKFDEVSYITNHGELTHAVVPIELWESIVDGVHDSNMAEIETKTLNLSKKTTTPGFSSIALIMQLDSPEFLESLKHHFWYLSTASAHDIALLYLIRTHEFLEYMDADEVFTEEDLEYLYSEFCIVDLQGQKLKQDKANKLRKLLLNNFDPHDMLNEFKKSYRFKASSHTKRIRRDAEMKRIFIFDILEVVPQIMPDAISDIDGLKETMASAIYPNNTPESAMAQLNKAHREARDRILNSKWKEYLQ